MPPSGFSQRAINGLLEFVEDAYKNTFDCYRGRDLAEESILRESIVYLGGLVEKSAPLALDGTISERGIQWLRTFVTTNYEDLIREIHTGKKREGSAIRTEIESIRGYLQRFKI